jgi:hypothetical protein
MTKQKGGQLTEQVEPSVTEKILNAGGKTFILTQPLNLIFFMSFFSPIILVIIIISMSFMFQNMKGLIYLGFVLGVSIIRRYVMEFSGADELKSDGTICTSIQFSKYGNITFGTFVFAFTMMYLCMPMFQNGSVNWLLFSFLLFYIFLDLGIKNYVGCLSFNKDSSTIFLDLLAGLSFGALIISIMYGTNNGSYLFFNETSSDKEICNMPSKQTFKCSVYKNGELIA